MDAGSRAVSTSPAAFRGVAGQLVTGVSVVVTLAAGEPVATTVSSVVAASWDPPLLAVFLLTGSRMAAALEGSARFTVNVLGEADHGLARRFARPHRAHGWTALAGIPLLRQDPSPPILASAVAWADCAVVRSIPIGDHHCYVSEVLDAGRDETAPPLAYYRGRFRSLGMAVAPAAWERASTADLAAVW